MDIVSLSIYEMEIFGLFCRNLSMLTLRMQQQQQQYIVMLQLLLLQQQQQTATTTTTTSKLQQKQYRIYINTHTNTRSTSLQTKVHIPAAISEMFSQRR